MQPEQVRPSDFNRSYAELAHSRVFREVVQTALGDLPEWIVPLSFTSSDDLEQIARALEVGPSETFVDLACGLGGPGLWVAEKTGAFLVGVDFSDVAIGEAEALAKRRHLDHRSRFVVANALDTGLPADAFAGVMSTDAIQMIDPHGIAREIARLLRPGGSVVVRTWEAVDDDPPRATMVRDYRPVFEAAGLQIITHREPAGSRERELTFFRTLSARAVEFRNEIGDAADGLLQEAASFLERGDTPRMRKVFLTAKKR
jgi:ubiquinone/menaquinone biosynthesis C-methylase UbiE